MQTVLFAPAAAMRLRDALISFSNCIGARYAGIAYTFSLATSGNDVNAAAAVSREAASQRVTPSANFKIKLTRGAPAKLQRYRHFVFASTLLLPSRFRDG